MNGRAGLRRFRAAFAAALSLGLTAPVLAESLPAAADVSAELSVFRRAYPDIAFLVSYDGAVGDWAIGITSGKRSSVVYRAGGRYLSRDQLATASRYRPLIYRFPEQIPDPSLFTGDDIERLVQFGSPEHRRTAPVSATAFFDAIYDSASLKSVRRHIVSARFLGRRLEVNERIAAPLSRVDSKVRALALSDPSVSAFIDSLESVQGYYWRTIRDTSGRSFHSLGIAIDLLPVGWEDKIVYWNWEKGDGNEQWMLIPLEKRWMPPKPVVSAFESEGFIWGGKWAVWDDMHFEYRPELILGRPIAPAWK